MDDIESAFSYGNWFCGLCVETFFPFKHFYDDNASMKYIEDLAQSSYIAAGLHNSTKVFKLFNINEDNNDIIEYHGNIDPVKRYISITSLMSISIDTWQSMLCQVP